MNSWEKMEKAKEGSYFEKKNQEALQRLKAKQESQKPRISPISGEPMVQEVLLGVVVDRCLKSGGVWLDDGELERLVEASKDHDDQNLLIDFVKNLVKK